MNEKLILRTIGIGFLIFGLLYLMYILKEIKKPNFYYNNRYAIHAIALSLLVGIVTIVDILKNYFHFF